MDKTGQSFTYASLDEDTCTFVQERTRIMYTRSRGTSANIIAIGQDLLAVNEKLAPRGMFNVWLSAEFDRTKATARHYMSVAKKFGYCNRLLHLSPTFLISILNIPDVAIEMIETGQIPLTHYAIWEARRKYRLATE